MNLQQRIDLLEELGKYILSDALAWREAREKAYRENNWFIPAFSTLASRHIAENWLKKPFLADLSRHYEIPAEAHPPKKIGIVMAGNIPLVGFHDFLCVFLSGNHAVIKLSSNDETLFSHLIQYMKNLEPAFENYVRIQPMLRGCDAYIATGSNNSARYFEYYFSRFPHIIRRNRTSVAILTGRESPDEMEGLAEDIHLYFGLGCRNVTKIYVPEGYDFTGLLEVSRTFNGLTDHHKYRHNYDYQLAILIINKIYYMTNGSLILREDPSLFSPIGVLHFEYYRPENEPGRQLLLDEHIQCVIGEGYLPFGKAQHPQINVFADGADTMKFLVSL